MKRLIAWSLVIILPILFVGCGKQEPTDQDQLGGKLQQNEFFKAIGQTPKNMLPGVDKGDTSVPCSLWRVAEKETVTYDINVNAPYANIPIQIKWRDTLFVVYTDFPNDTIRVTVAKPAPFFTGNLTFHYKHEGGEWKFDKLTPIAIKSDFASPYVKLDSIQIEVVGQGSLPSITNPATPISVENYPYVFNVGDSVKIRVYESGQATSRWVFLHAPGFDHVSWFEYNTAGGYWESTWVPKTSGTHWGWVDLWDLDVLLDRHVLTERDELWGIPYKVQ